MRNPVNIPGSISGIITFVKACLVLHPKSRAAEYISLLICLSLGSIERNTLGTQNEICAMISETQPVEILAAVNNNMSDTPVTISGLNNGMFVTVFMVVLSFLLFNE